MSNFALAIEKLLLCYGVLLGYGVMVTLQILVLSFLVRVRVSQQQFEHHPTRVMFFFVYIHIPDKVVEMTF